MEGREKAVEGDMDWSRGGMKLYSINISSGLSLMHIFLLVNFGVVYPVIPENLPRWHCLGD